MTKAHAEDSARPEATPGPAPRSVALASTVIGESELAAPPGTEADSFVRRVISDDAPTRLVPGQVVDGAYRIERALGQGGMGVVFLARDLRLDRPVALKILRGVKRAASVERLLREARAMAQLVHPNVVTVYDVGQLDDDVYVAMEFLDGGTMRQWQGKPRTWREIVAAYVQAGQGLAAAHQAGFVHRDFKPDNILLGADGRVRVADFGLVRQVGEADGAEASGRLAAIDSDLVTTVDGGGPERVRDAASVTSTGTVMGTPAYMAPEQHAGAVVGPAADQFAFCVSLWEALHGERPFAGDSMLELAKAVRAQVVRPAPRDRIVPAHLRRALLRGLAVDPGARFPSMAALIATLRHDPAATRRRALAGLAAVAAVAAIGAWWLTRDRASSAADACADAAGSMAPIWPARADAVAQAFAATSRPYAGVSSEHVRDAFDRFAGRWTTARIATCRAQVAREETAAVRRLRERCLDAARDQFAGLVGAFTQADAKVVDSALSASARLPDLDRCDDVALLQRSPLAGATELPPQVVRTTQTMIAARTAFDTGRFKEARELLAPVITEVGDGDSGDPDLGASLFMLHGIIANSLNDTATARTAFERAAKLAAQAQDDRLVASAWISLLEILDKLGKSDEAEGLGAVIEAALARSGNPARQRAQFLSALGRVRTNTGRYAEAHAAFAEARALVEADPSNREDLTGLLNRTGILYKREGKLADARALFERSIELQVELRGRDHPYTLASISNLATVISEGGDLAAALPLQEEVLATRTRLYGADDPSNFTSHTNLGGTLQTLGRYDEAAGHYDLALAIARKQPNPRLVWTALHNVGSIALDRGQPDAAVASLTAALAAGAQAPGADNPELLATYTELAAAQLAAGDATAALATVDAGRRGAGGKFADGDPHLAGLEIARSDALLGARRAGPARATAAAVLATLRASGPLGGMIAVDALTALGRAELALRHRPAAAAAFTEAYGLAVATLGDRHPRVIALTSLIDKTK